MGSIRRGCEVGGRKDDIGSGIVGRGGWGRMGWMEGVVERWGEGNWEEVIRAFPTSSYLG